MSNGSNGAFAGMRFGSEPERLMTARAIQGKRVLLISAFDRAYFRVKQECALLEASAASYTCIAPGSGRGIKPASWLRLLSVVWQAFVIPKRQYDSVFVTGAPAVYRPIFARAATSDPYRRLLYFVIRYARTRTKIRQSRNAVSVIAATT